MRYAAIILATLSAPAIAQAPGDVPKPGGGFINRQTGVESWPYRGVDLSGVQQGNNLAPAAAPVVASIPPKPVLCRPTGPDLRIVCDEPKR